MNSMKHPAGVARLLRHALGVLAILAGQASAAGTVWVATQTQAFLPEDPQLTAGAMAGAVDLPGLVAASRSASALPADQVKRIAVSLLPRNRDLLDALAWTDAGEGGAGTQAGMSMVDFNRYFLPTQEQASKVADYLRSQGFTRIQVSSSRRVISAEGSVASIEAAFHTKLKRFAYHGREVYANAAPAQVPQALGGLVGAVLGLQDVSVAQPFVKAADEADAKRAAAASGGLRLVPHQLSEFPALYHADVVAPGTRESIGIVASGDLTKTLANLQAYIDANHLPQPQVEVVKMHPELTYTEDPMATIAWTLTSQAVLAASGGLKKLVFYNPPTLGESDLLGTYDYIFWDYACRLCGIDENAVQQPDIVVNTFGELESAAYRTGFMSSLDFTLMYGPYYIVASGDSGAYAGGQGAIVDAKGQWLIHPDYYSVYYPASARLVNTVGGTSLYTTSGGAYAKETAWNAGLAPIEPGDRESDLRLWATSGGVSHYQSPVIHAGIPYKTTRVLPDIAFDADSASGALVYFATDHGTVQRPLGGTSLAAALFAGFFARIDAGGRWSWRKQPYDLRLTTPIYYPHQPYRREQFVRPVNEGDNGYGGYGYPSVVGFDGATGWGSLDVEAFRQAWVPPQ